MLTVAPEAYDNWYRTPRGRWIGGREARLISRCLAVRPTDTVLDVGCGTGFFTRFFASRQGGSVVGVDPDASAIHYARRRAVADEAYVVGRAETLPFPSGAFDLTISVTALCFIRDETAAVREILRVTRRRFAIGLLNRHSVLWSAKGRAGGTGSYRGARWHTRSDAARLFKALRVPVSIRTAIHLPSGRSLARLLECLVPSRSPWGSFLLVVGDTT
jgi:SAM-dependent methyltransferase